MRGKKPCVVCGNPTKRLLFKDKTLHVPLCSGKCEHEYMKNLSPNTTEQLRVIQYLDDKIEKCRKHNRLGWIISIGGVLLFLIAFLLPDVTTFIAGNIVAVFGALATRHYEDAIRKLTIQRKRIMI